MGFLWVNHFFPLYLWAVLAEVRRFLLQVGTVFTSLYFPYSTFFSQSLSNRLYHVCPIIADSVMESCHRKWQWGWRDCMSDFIWSDQKHNYALLANNKAQLNRLGMSFINEWMIFVVWLSLSNSEAWGLCGSNNMRWGCRIDKWKHIKR